MRNAFGRIIGLVFSVAMIAGALGFMAGILDLTRNMGFEYTLLGLGGAVAVYWMVLKGPIGKAVGSLLEGEEASDSMTGMRLEDVEDRVQELSLETRRLLEIEDRLEFAERLLAQRSEEGVGDRR